MTSKKSIFRFCALGLVAFLNLSSAFAQQNIELKLDDLRNELTDKILSRGNGILGYEQASSTLLGNVDKSIERYKEDVASTEKSIMATSSLSTKNKKLEIELIEAEYAKSLRRLSSLDSLLRFSSSSQLHKINLEGEYQYLVVLPILVAAMFIQGSYTEKVVKDQYGHVQTKGFHRSGKQMRKEMKNRNANIVDSAFKECQSNACILALSEDYIFWIRNSYIQGQTFQSESDSSIILKAKNMISEKKLERVINKASQSLY